MEKTAFEKTVDLLLPLLIYYVASTAANWLLWQLMEITLQHGGENWQAFLISHAAAMQSILSGCSTLAGLLSISKIALPEIKSARHVSLLPFPVLPSFYRLLFLCVFAASSAVGLNLFFSLTGFTESSEVYRTVSALQFDVPFWAGLIILGILSPFAEEVLFRGILYNRMRKYFSLPLSLVISSLLFGIYHGNIVQGVYGTLMGFFIVLVYHKLNTFLAPFLFHCIANLGIFTISYHPEIYGIVNRPVFCFLCMTVAALCFFFLLLFRRKANNDSH